MKKNGSTAGKRILPYALLSLGGFLCGLVLIALLLWNAAILVRLGLDGRFFYLVLLPLGLAAAAFLFGALRSYAVYKGRPMGGALELGGPVVGFALVVIGGFILPPPATNFALTVYLHGPAGVHDLALKNDGALILDLGSERRREPIGDKGQAIFAEIPANFRGQRASIGLDDPQFELVNGSEPRLLDATLYLEVHRKLARISGTVLDDAGKPIPGATVAVADVSASTDPAGRFQVDLVPAHVQDELPITVTAERCEAWRGTVVPYSATSPTIIVHCK
jgi:hypothetical protein